MESTVPLKTRRTSIKTENVPIIKIVMPTWVTTGSESRSLQVSTHRWQCQQALGCSKQRLQVCATKHERMSHKAIGKDTIETQTHFVREVLSMEKNRSSPTCSLHCAIKIVTNANILVTPWKTAIYCRDPSPNTVFLLIERHVILMFQLGPMVSLY